MKSPKIVQLNPGYHVYVNPTRGWPSGMYVVLKEEQVGTAGHTLHLRQVDTPHASLQTLYAVHTYRNIETHRADAALRKQRREQAQQIGRKTL